MLKTYIFAQSKIEALKDHLRDLRQDESGAAMIEYALIVGLVAVAAVAVIGTLSADLNARITSISTAVKP